MYARDVEMQKQAAIDKEKKRLQDQLSKRKIELGVSTMNKKDEARDLIFRSGSHAALKKKEREYLPQIVLLDLEEEEDRDKEAINGFMKKYGKLWRNFFHKYANSCYSSKVVLNFDQLLAKLHTINMAEITRMLKDHNTYPSQITKEEIATLIRMINVKLYNKFDTSALDYEGFVAFMTQLAYHLYSKPPLDLSHMPPVETMKAMVEHFKKATKQRGQSVVLFEDPDIVGIGDQELIKELNRRLLEDPTYPVPEGFYKQKEKIPSYSFTVPTAIAEVAPEQYVFSLEILDGLMDNLFGIHIFEQNVTFNEITKCRPQITNLQKPKGEKAEALNYMKKVDKKVKFDATNDY